MALLVAMSAVVLSTAGLFDPVEDALTAHRAELLTRQPTGQTVIVEIDARSLAELRSWPWPRSYHARLVRQLHQSGASIIAFDVDFSARSASGDEELASAIDEAGHVILPTFEQKLSDRHGEQRTLASRPDAIFSDAWIGGVNIFPDHDGMVREYPAAIFIDGAIQPSIATLVAEKNELGDRSFQPDWAIDAARIPRLSFVDVMDGRVPRHSIAGKKILIGATAIELGDRYSVPQYGVVPGVVVQALAVESLLQDRAIQRTGGAVTFAGILLVALLLRPRPVHRSGRYVAYCAAVLAAMVSAPVLVQYFWPVSVDSAPWLFTALAAMALQAAVEARRRLRLREEIDADSGLPNRTLLEAALSDDVREMPVLVTAAIERFEAIRDSIGLAATNEMIGNAANAISSLIDGQIYRIAPDVLAWVQPSGDDAEIGAVLERIHSTFRTPVDTNSGKIDVIFTLGLDRAGPAGSAVLRIERALSAIGMARSMGKSHAWYSHSDPRLRRQLSMMSDLRQAMADGRIELAYQPKLHLPTGRIADAEALIRWRDRHGESIAPDEFIPLAESTGVIREVTEFALKTSAKHMTKWAKAGVRLRVAINVSALDLATDDLAEEIDRILSECGVEPGQLALEVTESALIRSPARAIATLNALRARGIKLSVDDYGTGQSTLSYLKQLPVHELKIDKSFITNLSTNESDTIMVRSTINLAHELGLQVVAEGVEDGATLDMLAQLGCDYAQGYFISKPIACDEISLLAQRQSGPRRAA